MFMIAAQLWFPLYMSIFFGIDVQSLMNAAHALPMKHE